MDYRENPDKTIEFLDNLEEGDRVKLELSDTEPTSLEEEGLWKRTEKEGTVYNGIVKDRRL